MPNFVISGRMDCPFFIHAMQIANYMSEKLPDVHISKHEYIGEAWNMYLLDINRKHDWHITKSPLVWKETGFADNKPILIGGLSEFWEHIDDYYGILTFLDRDTVERLRLDKLKAYEDELDAKKRMQSLVIGLFGFNNRLAQMILPELFEIPGLFCKKAIIKIFDYDSLINMAIEDKIQSVLDDYRSNIMNNVDYELIFCTKLASFVEGTNLILITEDYSQQSAEGRNSWLRRCSTHMKELANEINEKAKDDLRIVSCHFGPVCFTATCLANRCGKNRIRNIVAVTAHEGLKVLNCVSKQTKIPTANLGAPPVWGFVGLDQYIDARGIVVMQDIVRPYKRAIKNIDGSTLPQKRVKRILRLLSCSVNQKDIENEMTKRCNLYSSLKREPVLPLLRATINFLGLWYSSERNPDQVISLGVFSTGAFGIPSNIVFSQPVAMDDKKNWIPYEKIPILVHSDAEIKKCIEFTEHLIQLLKDYFYLE